MNKKSILFVWSADYPWDIRLEKEINTLQKNGYKCSLLVRNTKLSSKRECINGLHIYRVGRFVSNSKFDKMLSFPFYINPLWFFSILKTVLMIRPDIIIIRDIPLALSVQFIAKLLNIKTIIDMAEPYPCAIKVFDKYMNNFITRFLFKNLDWYQSIENNACRNAKHIFVVVQDNCERIKEHAKISSNKISIVSNTPKLKSLVYKNDFFFENISPLKIVYTGNVDGSFRGVSTLLEAANLLKNSDVEFNIVGVGSYIRVMRDYIQANNLNNINLIGKMLHNELLNFLNKQHIGIIPHDNSDYIQYTIPNKIFDYMAHSLPVITSSARPLKRIVEETNCGYVYEACNPKSLAECINYILNHNSELYEKSQNGYNAVKSMYNWENDEKIMLNVIKKILEQK